MTGYYFVAAFFAVLHISTSSDYKEYNIGKLNDTDYVIKERMFPFPYEQELIAIEPDGTIQNFSFPDCGVDKSEIFYTDMKLRENHLFLRRENMESEGQFLQIVDLSNLNNIPNEICISIAAAYFGEQNIYIYKIEKDNILKRWLVMENGEEKDPVVVAKTENEIRNVYVYSDRIAVTTKMESSDEVTTVEFPQDLPQCEIAENYIPCEEDELSKQKSATAHRTAFEENVRDKVIVVSTCFLILILLAIGSCILNSKSRREQRYHSEIDSSDYIPIINSSYEDSYTV